MKLLLILVFFYPALGYSGNYDIMTVLSSPENSKAAFTAEYSPDSDSDSENKLSLGIEFGGEIYSERVPDNSSGRSFFSVLIGNDIKSEKWEVVKIYRTLLGTDIGDEGNYTFLSQRIGIKDKYFIAGIDAKFNFSQPKINGVKIAPFVVYPFFGLRYSY